MSARTGCDVLEYRNLTMRPVFTDWLMSSQVLWHFLNEVNYSSLHLTAGLSTAYIWITLLFSCIDVHSPYVYIMMYLFESICSL